MKVQEHHGLEHGCNRPNEPNFNEELGMMEGSIEVSAQKTCPEVAGHHPIHIHHRQYLENDSISQLFSLGRTEIVQQPV